MKNMEKSKLHYLEEFNITHTELSNSCTVVNLPLKYKATMNLKGNKKFSILYTKLTIKKGNSDNKIFWKRDNRREEKKSQILVNNKEAMKSI